MDTPTENPTMMPYTFEDVLAEKDVGEIALMRDWVNLVLFEADTNPRKFCGNKTLYYYQFGPLLRCRRDSKKYKTLKEVFDDPVEKEKLWRETIQRNRRDKDPLCSATDVYEAHRINRGSIVFFKSSTAKFIYKKYNATSVLDFTAGWGGRLLGAMSMGIKYTGIDTNLTLKDGYDRMIDDVIKRNKSIKNPSLHFYHLTKEDYTMIWDSCLNVDLSQIEYDCILTSPPYVNLELYEGMDPFESDHDFYHNFLMPMMYRSYEYLKDDGAMCINISPRMYKKLMSYGVFRLPDEVVDLRQQLGQQFKTKSQDEIYVWIKNQPTL